MCNKSPIRVPKIFDIIMMDITWPICSPWWTIIWIRSLSIIPNGIISTISIGNSIEFFWCSRSPRSPFGSIVRGEDGSIISHCHKQSRSSGVPIWCFILTAQRVSRFVFNCGCDSNLVSSISEDAIRRSPKCKSLVRIRICFRWRHLNTSTEIVRRQCKWSITCRVICVNSDRTYIHSLGECYGNGIRNLNSSLTVSWRDRRNSRRCYIRTASSRLFSHNYTQVFITKSISTATEIRNCYAVSIKQIHTINASICWPHFVIATCPSSIIFCGIYCPISITTIFKLVIFCCRYFSLH